jgi:hypothetical protein
MHVWLACMAVVFALLAAMYGVGTWQQRRQLSVSQTRSGVSLTYQTALSALGLAGLCFVFPSNMAATIALVVIVGVATSFHEQVASRSVKLLFASTNSPL